MYTKQEIILKSFREGKSQRAISRELGINRKTVKKYIEEYEAWLSGKSPEDTPLNGYLSSPIRYDASNRSKVRLTEEVKKAIDQLLDQNEIKRQQGLRKQLLKKCDILENLHEQGYQIGYTTVCNYINTRKDKGKPKEAFIRQQYDPGSVCEFDWGEIKLLIDGVQGKYYLAVFTSAYSNYRFSLLFSRQDTLAFMEAHTAFFAKTTGVHHQMVYDNMRVAIARFTGSNEKEPTQALLQLRGHYHFTHRFCNIYRGNEKGHVERSVEYVRRKSFGLKSEFKTLQQANIWLEKKVDQLNQTRQQLTGKTAMELFLKEKEKLKPAPAKMLCSEQVQLRVDKYATISYKTNRYSVPDHLVGAFIDVKVMSEELHLFEDQKRIGIHSRSYGKHQWIIKVDHYLETFKRKPGALAGSRALASSGYLKELFTAHFKDHPRDFIDLLSYCKENKIADQKLQNTVEKLYKSGVRQLTGAKIQVLLGNKTEHTVPYSWTQTTQMAKSQLNQISALIN
ncbi:MAG TPA: IS21 family transposase [Salinimicrobium sp.]|nr:IS21 family transposase [Salinimicrobium sp.]